MDNVVQIVLINLLLTAGSISLFIGFVFTMRMVMRIIHPRIWEPTGVHKYTVIEWSWDRERVLVRLAIQERCFQTGQLRWRKGTRQITWSKEKYFDEVAAENVLGPQEKIY